MKTRNSFVANSSSSSFLIIGITKVVEVEGMDDCECYDMIDQYKEDTGLDAIQICEDEAECFVGKIIYQSSGSSMSIEKLDQKIADAKVFLKEKGIEGATAHFGTVYNG